MGRLGRHVLFWCVSCLFTSSEKANLVENINTQQTQHGSPMNETTPRAGLSPCHWTPQQIEEKREAAFRRVREREQQNELDGVAPDGGKATPLQRVERQLGRLRDTWLTCQQNRDRDAIYDYLTTVHALIERWRKRGWLKSRIECVEMLLGRDEPLLSEPFALVIEATADRKRVDRKTRSKWSRVLRFADRHNYRGRPLMRFIKRKGGINACAAQYAGHLRRQTQK